MSTPNTTVRTAPPVVATAANKAGPAEGQAANAIVANTSDNSVRKTGQISSAAAQNLPPERFAAPGLQNPMVTNGPVNDAYQLVAAVTGSNNARPQQLLAALSNQASSNFSTVEKVYRQKLNDALDRQTASLSSNERGQAIARLRSPATAALLAALREGTGVSGLKDRSLIQQSLRQMAQQLQQLQTRFGVEADASVPKQVAAEARTAVDEFVRKLDDSLNIQRRTMDGAEARQMSINRTLGSESDLASREPHSQYPFVCYQFIADSLRNNYVLEHPDGSKEFLVPPEITRNESVKKREETAARRLLEFCGEDQTKSLLLSRMANQSCLPGTLINALFAAGKLDLPTDGTGMPAIFFSQSARGSNYLIRANENGSHSVFANDYNQLTGSTAPGDGSTPGDQLNSNLSHHYAQVQLEASADNKVHLEGLKYDFVAAPLLAIEENAEPLGNDSNFYGAEVDKWEVVSEQHDLDALGEFKFRGADIKEANRLAEDADGLRAEIEGANIDPARKQTLLQRLEFIADAQAEIGRLVESGRADDAEMAVARSGDLLSDLRLLQQDLKVKLDYWNESQQNPELATLTAALFAALGAAAAEFEGTAADQAAALDDARGNLDAVAASSLTARSENALAQAETAVLAISKAISSLSPQQLDDSGQLLDLLQEAQQRYTAAKRNYNAVRTGADTGTVSGPGALKGELRQLQQELRARLDRGEKLPATHPRLSEANLFQMQVEKFKSDNPALAGVLAEFNADFAQIAEDASNNRSWQPIEKRFSDIDAGGTLSTVTSRIVPAKNFAAGFDHYGGSDRGVSSHSRSSGLHLSNLASSSLANEKGTVFAGLRHGIIDAYSIKADKIAGMPESRLEKLHRNTLAADDKWRAWAAERGGGDFTSDLRLMRTGDGSRIAAERAREVANRNAAVELVRAAIVEDPFLYRQAVEGKNVEVTLDSVSLVTPDYLRGLIGAESERQMQQNQRAALAEISGEPIQIELIDKNGNLHLVPVKVDARDFNFGVNSYAVARGEKIPLFGKLMGWDSADARNGQLLEKMLGPLDAPGFGGEVADALQYLDTGEAPDNMSEQARHVLAGQDGDAFADRILRASAITTLASQIKEIYNSGAHRRGGADPYKLVARLAVLSNLLGHTTCYNCKSGKDRTGQLDVEAKMIAHRLAIGETPQPGESVDHVRRTNFALKTGNLEMQGYNSGLEGYKLDVPALSSQLGSPLAQRMFAGDSASVPA